MGHAVRKKTYTFFMPAEERIFFRYFHVIAIVLFLVVALLRVFVSNTTADDAVFFAVVLVLPMYLLRLLYGKRFAESVTLDFDTRTVRFAFSDDREAFNKDFHDIKKIIFGFYLTFVLDEGRVMVKRPGNKKDVFRLLRSVAMVDSGLFKGF
jgi:hypothetical protein